VAFPFGFNEQWQKVTTTINSLQLRGQLPFFTEFPFNPDAKIQHHGTVMAKQK
jgi:hypothetical protein